MENQNSEQPKFLGMKRDALIAAGAVFAPTLTVLVVVVALFGVTNANISRLNDTVTNLVAQSAAQNAAQDTAIEALHSDLRDLNEDVDALSADVLELKLESVRTNNRFDNIDTRLDSLERGQTDLKGSIDNLERGQTELKDRIDNLERGQTDLKDRIDNIERGQTELKDHVDALRPIQPADQ